MKALTKWRQYLLNAIEKFEVWIDHENLKYFREAQKLNRQQARWYLKLQDYDFILQHIPGKMNTKADILLRKDQVNTRQQQGCTDIERRIMDKENDGQNNYVMKEYKRRLEFIKRNTKKQH